MHCYMAGQRLATNRFTGSWRQNSATTGNSTAEASKRPVAIGSPVEGDKNFSRAATDAQPLVAKGKITLQYEELLVALKNFQPMNCYW